MITCHRSNLEARCSERGYTLDDVMPCVVSQEGDEWTIDTESEFYPRVSRLPSPPAPDLTRTDAPSFLTKVKNFASAADLSASASSRSFRRSSWRRACSE
jgi:hypothetical protein